MPNASDVYMPSLFSWLAIVAPSELGTQRIADRSKVPLVYEAYPTICPELLMLRAYEEVMFVESSRVAAVVPFVSESQRVA
jgi:hypothetical protein